MHTTYTHSWTKMVRQRSFQVPGSWWAGPSPRPDESPFFRGRTPVSLREWRPAEDSDTPALPLTGWHGAQWGFYVWFKTSVTMLKGQTVLLAETGICSLVWWKSEIWQILLSWRKYSVWSRWWDDLKNWVKFRGINKESRIRRHKFTFILRYTLRFDFNKIYWFTSRPAKTQEIFLILIYNHRS